MQVDAGQIGIWFLWREENQYTWTKPRRTNNKFICHWTVTEAMSHSWEANALTVVLSLLLPSLQDLGRLLTADSFVRDVQNQTYTPIEQPS